MRFASLRSGDLAVIEDGHLIPFSAPLIEAGVLPPGASMIEFIARRGEIGDATSRALERGPRIAVDPALLGPPVERVSKIWAAARNYPRGESATTTASGAGAPDEDREQVLTMAFLKPPSAIVGPEDAIVIPEGAQIVFPEIELCIVIGETVHGIPRERALDAVFGYTIILDVTARQYRSSPDLGSTRCVRKAFDTFAPVGPWITTREAVPDPRDLQMDLWINDEHRYSARSEAMLNGVAELVSFFSTLSTLEPGDLIATGNPNPLASQHQIAPGDEIRASIGGLGELRLSVRSPTPGAA